MKKLLLLFLLISMTISYGQTTLANKLKITGNTTSVTAAKVNVQEADGIINTIAKSDLIEVLEFDSAVSMPITGVAGKIYVTKDNSKIYRWNGTYYAELAITDISGKVDKVTGKSLISDSEITRLSTVTNQDISGKENAFSKNTAFNKNFGTTSGTVVDGGTLGSNAYTSTAFLPLNGTAYNSTLWGGLSYDGAFQDQPIAYILSRDGFSDTYKRTSDVSIKSWLGLGSNAYTSTDYLPLSGGTLSGNLTATAFFQSSDRRLKTILKRDGDVAYFKWKDGRDSKTHIGYIAQEVRKNNPDQVQKGEDKMLSVNYVEILVEKIRVLEKRIEELEKK